jgi:histidine triad (HIT) family protein
MDDCVFCRIMKGVAPSSVVYSDEEVMAFMDTQPVNRGHVLVIPCKHSAMLSELNPETGARMFKVAMRIAEGLRQSGVRCEGVNLFLADGKAAFQEVFHVHLYVIPRFEEDEFGFKFPSSYDSKPGRTELDEIAAKIRTQLSDC